ncbi:MAG: SLBB domain-containing protein [Selenomonadaceae bacterium]|nr:SLBB domain-containing protein [Selenomonadaceae bacterium]
MLKKFAVAAILAVVLVAASFLIFSGTEEEIPAPPPPAPKKIAVYVSGQVKTPAVITLEDNGNLRAIDAVNAVGGLTELADTENVNLA